MQDAHTCVTHYSSIFHFEDQRDLGQFVGVDVKYENVIKNWIQSLVGDWSATSEEFLATDAHFHSDEMVCGDKENLCYYSILWTLN